MPAVKAAILLALAGAALVLPGDAGRAPAGAGPVPVLVRTAAQGQASGFVVGPDRVVTVAHVLDGTPLTVRIPGGPERGLRATVSCTAADDDLALLAVPGLGGRRVVFARGAATDLRVRRAAGPDRRARGLGVVDAVVDELPGASGRRRVVVLEGTIDDGDSGAAVTTAGGRLAGVVFARSEDRRGRGYATAAPALRRMIAGRDCP